jgi:phage shock protein PspC (stress-responsive transcriptional regulator)
MNKTVTINISGIIFHIEEDAFEKLSRYLGTIKGYFSASEGRDEIMGDIESRIAEILKEKTSTSKQVVLMNDVDAVISMMGQPEEFASNESASYTQEPRMETFSQSTSNRRRRVFRNPDDKILGGVCSGISAYFDMDPLWVRLALALLFFAFGFGFFFYILLWIIIPEAKTTADKLEMKGEKVTVDNISKTVQEELDHLKKKVNDWQKEASNIGSTATGQRTRRAANDFGNFLSSIFGSIFKILGKILAVLFILIGTVLLIAVLGSIFGINDIVHINNYDQHFSYSLQDLLGSVTNSSGESTLIIIALGILIGIPALMLIYSGIKRLFGIKVQNKYIIPSAAIIWAIGLILCFYTGSKVGSNYSKKSTHRQIIPIQKSSSDTLYLSAGTENNLFIEEENESHVKLNSWNYIKNNDKELLFGNPEITIEKSETDSFELVAIKTARGKNNKEASINAKSIIYAVNQKDSLLIFDPIFNLKNEKQFRDQQLRLVLKVPVGKVIYLDKNLKELLSNIDNVSNTWDWDMVGRRWKMTIQGLACVDCQGIPTVPPVDETGNSTNIDLKNGIININDSDNKEVTRINIRNGNIKVESRKTE